MDPNPVTVTGETEVQEVIRLLRRHDLRGLPVVDDDGRLRGIITESDLVIADEEGDLHLPHYIQLFGGYVFLEPLKRFEDRLQKAFAATAADMMTRNPQTVEPAATIHDAGRIIAETGHDRLPVAEGEHLVGIVTRADVLGALAREG
jgi:CBS-domain-containing membrane protein